MDHHSHIKINSTYSIQDKEDAQKKNNDNILTEKEIQLNDEQEQAVKVIDNAVVIAGAGSGKTTVLVLRVIQLMLSHKVPLSQILVLTFTIKASAEMQARIRKQLLQTIENQSHLGVMLSKEELIFLEEQLSNYTNAQISTIDSFCLRIANTAANRLGYVEGIRYSPNYDTELNDFVFQWIFKQKKDKSAIISILSAMDINEVIDDYILPLLHKLNAEDIPSFFDIDSIFQQCSNRVHLMLHGLQQDITEKALYINDIFKRILEIDDNRSLKERVNYFFSAYEIILHKEWKKTEIDRIQEQLKKIDFRGKIKDILSPQEKVLFKKFREQVFEYNCTYMILESEKSISSTYKLFYEVLKQLALDWVEYRKKNALFSFNDIANLASKVLEQYTDIQKWLASSYRFVIVDEAQDNNFQQKSFLYNLSKHYLEKEQSFQMQENQRNLETKKFFFVGDPQQSIYSFRGAEVQSFTTMKKEMQTTLYLRYNHRSSSFLIDFFNVFFDFLFNNQDTQFQKMFNPSDVHYQVQRIPTKLHNAHNDLNKHAIASVPIDTPPVVLTLYRKEEQETLTIKSIELEAYDIAQKVHTLCKEKNYTYEDIAVLSKNKDVFPYLLKYFTILSIPHSISEAGMGLRMDIGVDFYAWLSLLLYPEDNGAYATVLRGPLVNISDSVVLDILIEKNDLFSVSQELQENPQYAQAVKNIYALHQRYSEAKELLKTGTVVDILDDFWLQCGYRYIILAQPNYHSFLDTYYVLRSFLQQQQELGGIIHVHTMLRNNLDQYSKGIQNISLGDMSTQGSGVHIMTIHASKGLEFPVVFVMGLGRNISPSLKHKVRVHGHQAIIRLPQNLVIAPSSDVQSSTVNTQDRHIVATHKLLRTKDDTQKNNNIMSTALSLFDKDRQRGESLRILYVAMTRAKQCLFLSGVYLEQSFFNEDMVRDKTFLDYLYTVIVSLQSNNNSDNDDMSKHIDNCYFESIHTLVTNSMLSDIEKKVKDLLHSQYVHKKGIKHSIDTALQECKILTTKSKIIERITSESPYYTKQEDYGKKFRLPMLACESILRKYRIYSDFGIYCHALISIAISHRKKRPEQSNRQLARALSNLQENERELFISTAENLASSFIQSSFYTQFLNDTIKKTEYPFLLWNKKYSVWLKGVIDLLIHNEEKLYIVDFKVDSYRYPDNHSLQISSYRLAVKKMFPSIKNVNIFCYVYYLRNAELVLIEAETGEDALFDVLTDDKKEL